MFRRVALVPEEVLRAIGCLLSPIAHLMMCLDICAHTQKHSESEMRMTKVLRGYLDFSIQAQVGASTDFGLYEISKAEFEIVARHAAHQIS